MNIIPRLSVFLILKVFNIRYRLARMTRKHPCFARVVKKVGFDGDDMAVVPKAGTAHRTVELNIEIKDAGDRNVVPTDLVKMVLNRSDKIFLMDFCICRRANECKDYPADHGCIFVGEGTSKIPSEYGRFVTRDEACEYIDDCDRLGLVHIIGRNKLDSIWLHTGKYTDLMTICNCCPCCCLWNMIRDIDGGISSVYKRMKGVEVRLEAEKCIGCGICMEKCFVRAIEIQGGKCVLDDAKCRACGRCSDECPSKAISLTYDPAVIGSEADRICSLINRH